LLNVSVDPIVINPTVFHAKLIPMAYFVNYTTFN
ncbi:MAG: hypothetical protein ACI8W0_000894, partial [Flavobacterium sp.]